MDNYQKDSLMDIIVNGFGTVGTGFVEILRDKSGELRERHGFSPRIVGVVDLVKGNVYHPRGLDPAQLLACGVSGALADYPGDDDLERDWDAIAMIEQGAADALVELTPTNLETGQPALDLCHRALDAGLHLALANKGPIALDFVNLRDKAKAMNRQMRYEATVMSGTPVLQMAREALAGCRMITARGILNGTTNYILTQMESDMDYAEALSQAQALGYAEADPAGDVDGWDAAGKVLILANALFDLPLSMADLDVAGISAISPADIAQASAAGERYKLIAELSAQGGSVGLRRLPLSDPLASVGGATNAITLETDLLGEVTLIGAGAGKRETGCAILSDLLAIHRAG